MNFLNKYLAEHIKISNNLDLRVILKIIQNILNIRKDKGRLFIIGVGGSAANASHAVNDFRKLCGIEAYSPADNISELTARTNDDGWESVFEGWLKVSNISKKDVLLILSVGGGNLKKNVSVNIIKAIRLAKNKKTKIISIVGKKDGYAAIHSDECLVVPCVNDKHITPHSETFQTMIWHMIVSHPLLKKNKTKW
jgi:D-sedoheptulose 7-phosphate isomerase